MVFNTEDEIRAYYQGRMDEADRWAYWQGGAKWCGTSDRRALQDILAELTLQMAQCLEQFRRQHA